MYFMPPRHHKTHGNSWRKECLLMSIHRFIFMLIKINRSPFESLYILLSSRLQNENTKKNPEIENWMCFLPPLFFHFFGFWFFYIFLNSARNDVERTLRAKRHHVMSAGGYLNDRSLYVYHDDDELFRESDEWKNKL
jgi:hypothetical protein